MTCKNPIGFETLIAYWLGEVPEKSEAKLDEHLFGCAPVNCASRTGSSRSCSGHRA